LHQALGPVRAKSKFEEKTQVMIESLSSQEKAEHHARILYEIGVEQVLNGKVSLAIETFGESLSCHPTAEAYTYRGWARSLEGDCHAAIKDCRRAIRIDRTYGNPYNDIGAYMIQLGKMHEAIRWLEHAKQAQRYACRHFPYLNLGYIYTQLSEDYKALCEYVGALEIDPDNSIAKQAIAAMDPTTLL
jgi:Tfp pilus assembly protein PilF